MLAYCIRVLEYIEDKKIHKKATKMIKYNELLKSTSDTDIFIGVERNRDNLSPTRMSVY